MVTLPLALLAVELRGQFADSVHAFLADRFPSDEPGAVFLVAREGEVLYQEAFGMANLELGVPMQTDNVFQIGSMTKQFTAVSVLILAEEGKLGLDDRLSEYIDDYPNGEHITIHHLLTHTSGIRDFTEVGAIRAQATRDLEPAELIDLFRDEPVDFEPGTDFKYNNSGYFLLGYIIEKLSGMSYSQFVEERIFQKAGMTRSRYASDRDIVYDRAYGYHKREQFTNKRHVSMTFPFSAGGLMSTAQDMFLWHRALIRGRLVSRSMLEKAFSDYTLNDGEYVGYGYGWHIREIDGMRSLEHGGSIFGFKSMGVYLPGKDIYVVGLTNCDCRSPTQLARDIASLAIK